MGKKSQLEHKFTLFIKFSRRVPNEVNINDSVRALMETVEGCRKPRQKSSRWVLADFKTLEHAEEFKKMLIEKKEISGIKIKVNKLNIKEHNSSEKPESGRQQIRNSVAKQSFQAKNMEKYSNKLLVTNLPESVTTAEISELFPQHTSLDLKRKPKLRAIVTYSSAKEAMQARKNVRPVIDGKNIRVILLLVEDNRQKQKASGSQESNCDVVKKEKKGKQPHAFVKPLRYFETDE